MTDESSQGHDSDRSCAAATGIATAAVAVAAVAVAAVAAADLYLDRRSHVLICLLCKVGISATTGGVVDHYRQRHQLKGERLRAVQAVAVAAVTNMRDGGGLVNPENAELPADGGTAVE